MKIGMDAKRLVRNGTGLGSYSRTLVNDLAQRDDLDLLLYAPDEGRPDLRSQVPERPNVHYCYPSQQNRAKPDSSRFTLHCRRAGRDADFARQCLPRRGDGGAVCQKRRRHLVRPCCGGRR